MIVQDDLELCYPIEYYAAGNNDRASLDASTARSPKRRLPRVRDTIRQAIADSVQGIPNGAVPRLGKLLAMSTRLRERAFWLIPDELIPRSPTRLRALDVGCGSGRFIAPLQRAGWEVEGIEWNPAAAEAASRKTRNRVWAGDFRDVELPQSTYDLIFLNHVLEHLNDPQAALRRINQLLAPGGQVVLFYPNPDSLGARLYGANWFHLEAPRHLVIPPITALTNVAIRIGFKVIKARTHGRDASGYFAHSRSYKANRPVDLLRPNVSTRDRLISTLERFLNKFVGTLGEEAVVVLQKP
jgi:2-polyprenyl-3-methyl-5-hydroxy-6-metoxy-1,4-benzoquinol methylase